MKSLEEINKNIAEFMGLTVHATCTATGGAFYREKVGEWNYSRNKPEIINVERRINYTSSLDAQIPVFEKMKAQPDFYLLGQGKWRCKTFVQGDGIHEWISESMPEASARALDAAIDGLKK